MKVRLFATAIISCFILLLIATPAMADTLKMKDGSKIEGIVKKIEDGKVYVEVGAEARLLNFADVASMEFVPSEAKDLAKTVRQLDKSAAEIRKLLAQIEGYWLAKQPIDTKDEGGWLAAKETFRQPLMAYQETLNDLYFHVLARVDQYNALLKDAAEVYVGVKGVRVGSALVPSELEELPLRKYVPAAWYETIFNNGFNQGYADAAARLTSPRGN